MQVSPWFLGYDWLDYETKARGQSLKKFGWKPTGSSQKSVAEREGGWPHIKGRFSRRTGGHLACAQCLHSQSWYSDGVWAVSIQPKWGKINAKKVHVFRAYFVHQHQYAWFLMPQSHCPDLAPRFAPTWKSALIGAHSGWVVARSGQVGMNRDQPRQFWTCSKLSGPGPDFSKSGIGRS
jgi:hypothetical protein